MAVLEIRRNAPAFLEIILAVSSSNSDWKARVSPGTDWEAEDLTAGKFSWLFVERDLEVCGIKIIRCLWSTCF